MNLNNLFENISPQQRRVGQLPADFAPRDTSPVLDGPYGKPNATQGYLVGEGAGDNTLQVGDPVIITGDVKYRGRTGDVREVGQDGAFVVVDLYNYGPYSFHASDVSYNDYADSDDENVSEGRVKELGQDLEDPLMSDEEFETKYGDSRANMQHRAGRVQDRKTGRFYDPEQEFDRLKNSPEFGAQMRRMAQQEDVAEETIHVGHRNSKGDWIKTSTHSNYADAKKAMAELEKQGKKGVQHRYDNKGSIDPGTHNFRKVDEQGVAEAFPNPGSGSTGSSKEDKRIAAALRKKHIPTTPNDKKQPDVAEGVELMTDAEVYRETLGVLALMGAGFAAGAYAKIKDIIKMYNADQIMRALEGYSVSNISDSERQALIKLIAEFKQAMAQRQGKQALAIAKQIKSIATDRPAVAEAGFETEPVKLNPGDAVTYQGAPAEVMSVAGNSVTLRHGGTTKSVPANTVSEAVDYAVMVGESVKRVFPARILAENYAAQLQQRRPQATVTVAEQHTTEDVVSAVKDRVGDYLQNVADAVKKDPELLDKITAAADDLGPAVKTITTTDGHQIKIHGNEDDGFRISIHNQALKSRFPKMEHAVMATEMYCARRQQKTNQDYLPEA